MQTFFCYLAICASLGWAFALTASPIQAQYAATKPCPEILRPGFESITVQQTQAWVNVLAGRNFQGRGTGQKGYAKSAYWVAGKLAEFGIEPIYADGDYFQSVPLEQKVPVLSECYLRAAPGLTIAAKGNIGFDTYSPKPLVMGKLLLIRCPEGRFKIPANASLRDAIVIYWASDATLKYASRKIESHQPAAMLHVTDTPPNSINQPTFAGQADSRVKGKIYSPAVERLLTATGLDPEDWKKNNTSEIKPGRSESATSSPGEVTVLDPRSNVALANPVRIRKISAPNVIGVLPGSDKDLRHQHIVIGSHLDHIGVTSGGVYPGADDNASGCAAVLSIAKALVANPTRPKRSVMFIFFAAEEIGLVGSNHYCKRPILPLRDAVCMLNIDMVGRNESSAKETADQNEGAIHLIGAKQGGNHLQKVIQDANDHVGFRFEFDEEAIFNRSDQFNFFRQGVGVAFLFGGFHPDYHQPTDHPDRLNYKKIQAAARLYYLTVFKADQHGRFSVTPDQRSKVQSGTLQATAPKTNGINTGTSTKQLQQQHQQTK